ncbi:MULTISPECIES: CAP domain-containing protein [unclassified Micromonospora]|uniref:CAP domain-containing protein n=1 Tax=unclassified Micromonospora TaxID=2617518 RepID=UPI0033BAC41C
MDPNGAPRRAERPTDEPDWLRDRPEPRSAYLFGDDDPDQPGDEWHRPQPTARWQQEPAAPAEPADGPTAAWPAYEPAYRQDDEATGDWRGNTPAEETTGGWPTDTTGAGRSSEGRHRSQRRWRRPLVIGGAAAAATLVVSLGVGALALPGGGGTASEPTAVDDTLAAAPAVPTEEPVGDNLVAPSPTTAPSSARPSPTPSKVVKPSPASSRATAASRRSTPRTSAPSSTTGTGSGGSGTVSAQAREVVDLVNAERAKAGCKALSIDDKLMTAAQRHSQDQADHKNMSHTGSDGSNAGVRLDRVGYAWRTYGENVAWNQKTPAAVMDAWMNSSGHRANILNCAFTEIGVGIANSNGPYWTQVFAAPR